MGRHETPPSARADATFWGTARRVARLPKTFLVLLLAVLTGLAIISVMVQNAYGGFWGALVSAGVAPFAGSMMLRSRLGRRGARPR